MTPLITTPNFRDPARPARHSHDPGDAFYAELIDAHRELSDAHSQLVNARLLLLLANHIGDLGVLRQALQLACDGLNGGGDDTPSPTC